MKLKGSIIDLGDNGYRHKDCGGTIRVFLARLQNVAASATYVSTELAACEKCSRTWNGTNAYLDDCMDNRDVAAL